MDKGDMPEIGIGQADDGLNGVLSRGAPMLDDHEAQPAIMPIRIGIIGCGGWGPNHIRNFNSLSGCKVAAVADIDAGRLARVAEMLPAVSRETDYRRVLADPNLNAVVVATPATTHAAIVGEALAAGKHVLCEKPLCLRWAEAQELMEKAKERGLVLLVGHVFLFNAGIIKLKEVLDSGEMGSLRYLSAVRTNFGPIRQDVNVAYDLAAHDIAIFNWLLRAEPQHISTTCGAYLHPGVEDVVFISLRYPGNVLASIQASWLNPRKVRQITLVGSRKMVTWDDLELSTPVAIYDCGAISTQDYNDYGEFLGLSIWDSEVRLPKVRSEEPLRVQARYFLESIRRGHAEISNGAFSAGVVKVLESIAVSIKRNNTPVQGAK